MSKTLSVAVMVSDGRKSARWFVEKLGFETEGEEHWITVWQKGADWKLHLCEGELEPGNTGISFYMDDVAKEAAELEKKGVKFSRKVTKKEWGTSAMIEDPDGNQFYLQESGP
ncbi:MAG: VOC family protein [Thaumarchaeota archaeon]|nr:VOC family protein [Nitrososphaerota archaeon]